MTTTVTLTKPDDWHLHVRDGAALKTTVKHSAARFGRAIIMPNLNPPVVSVADAEAYRRRIMDVLPPNSTFEPLMTLYLTDHTTEKMIKDAHRHPHIHGVKLYPAHATTGSEHGITSLEALYPVFAVMEEIGFPLLIHGEVTDTDVDIFDREKVFIDRYLSVLYQRFPKLKMVFEHISSETAVQFVKQAGGHVAATITIHHLLVNRNAMLAGGIRPHMYCLPVVKTEQDRLALIEAATGGQSKFFLGTDSAPHPVGKKQSACGSAGIYSAAAAIELYAHVFEQAGTLDKLEAFASLNGPAFYGLPPNNEQITLAKQDWTMPERFPLGDDEVIPFYAGQTIPWAVT